MDLRPELRSELGGAGTLAAFSSALLRFGAARTRCPNAAFYVLVGDAYVKQCACGKGKALPDSLPAPPPTSRSARNVHLPGDEPGRPPAFLRLEWDGPEIHDREALDGLEAACVDAATVLARLAG